jgi:hypothetical protein
VPARVLLTIASSEDAIIAAKCAAASGGALESAKGSRKRNKSSYRISQRRAVHEVIFLLKIGNALALNSIAVPREPTGIYGASRRLHRVVGKIFRMCSLQIPPEPQGHGLQVGCRSARSIRPGFCRGGTLKIFACYTLEPTAKPMDMSGSDGMAMAALRKMIVPNF